MVLFTMSSFPSNLPSPCPPLGQGPGWKPFNQKVTALVGPSYKILPRKAQGRVLEGQTRRTATVVPCLAGFPILKPEIKVIWGLGPLFYPHLPKNRAKAFTRIRGLSDTKFTYRPNRTVLESTAWTAWFPSPIPPPPKSARMHRTPGLSVPQFPQLENG